MKMRLCVFLFIGIFCLRVCAQPYNRLNKVFHHHGNIQNNDNDTVISLELGRIVFYFQQEPIFNMLEKKRSEGGQEEYVFLFPMAEVKSGECKRMIQRVNRTDTTWYSVHIEEVSLPTHGIRLSISFDAERVTMSQDLFVSIGLQNGVEFSFFNKKLLKKIEKNDKPILRMASSVRQPSVVLDYGHGGLDCGTTGCFNIKEKDITFDVGRRVARMLESQGIGVKLCRNDDTAVALDQRTWLANGSNGDVLISIHANASVNGNAKGVETFCLDSSLFGHHVCLPDPSLSGAVHNVLSERFEKSHLLASSIQHNIIAAAQKKNRTIVDRNVKYAVSQVLLGSRIPSVLVEIGFLTNEREAKLLHSPSYQKVLAQGICRGINTYFRRVIA